MKTRFTVMTFFVAIFAYSAIQAHSSEYFFLVMDRFTMSESDFDLMITGQVKEGKIVSGSKACLTKASGDTVAIRIDLILRSRKAVEVAVTGEIIALGITGVEEDDVAVGDVISAGCL